MAPCFRGKTAGGPASKARLTNPAFTPLKTSSAAVSPKAAFTALEPSFTTVFPETSLLMLKTSFAAVSSKTAFTALESSFTTVFLKPPSDAENLLRGGLFQKPPSRRWNPPSRRFSLKPPS